MGGRKQEEPGGRERYRLQLHRSFQVRRTTASPASITLGLRMPLASHDGNSRGAATTVTRPARIVSEARSVKMSENSDRLALDLISDQEEPTVADERPRVRVFSSPT